MIKSAGFAKEIVVTVANRVGVLAEMSKILADHGVNLEGVAGYAKDKDALIMLIVDDALRAIDALKAKGYSNTKENNVVVVELENKAGALKNLTFKLAEAGVDINYIYGTTCSGDCAAARIVLDTNNNEKALVVLKGK